MDNLAHFDINFIGLKPGIHRFSYEIDNSFFEAFEKSLLNSGDLYVHLTFDKEKETFFVLDFFVDGTVNTTCDRCLEPVQVQINGNYRIAVKFDTEEASRITVDPDLILLPTSAVKLNVAQQIFEFINLMMPIRVTCSMDVMGNKQCNEEVVKHILNKAPDTGPERDPRWDALKDWQTNQ